MLSKTLMKTPSVKPRFIERKKEWPQSQGAPRHLLFPLRDEKDKIP